MNSEAEHYRGLYLDEVVRAQAAEQRLADAQRQLRELRAMLPKSVAALDVSCVHDACYGDT